MFELDLLPAEHGDCLWMRWGEDADAPYHLLIDGGPIDDDVQTALRDRMAQQLGTGDDAGRLELLVVTHVDADHVGGILALVRDGVDADIGDVWFNAWDHLPTDVLGARQGEELSDQLVGRTLPWNARFDGKAVALPDDGDAPLPTVSLPGGLTLTLLGPTRQRLRELAPQWLAECRKAGLVPGVPPEPESVAPDVLGDERPDPELLAAKRFRPDTSKPNGSSIVLLAEHGDRRVLLCGDAFGTDVVAGLDRLARERGGRVPINVCKLPHHGSRANVSPDLVAAVRAGRYLFSTSGKQFKHPDPEAIARILVADHRDTVELAFNYRTRFTTVWDDRELRERYEYVTTYPAEGTAGLHVDLTAAG